MDTKEQWERPAETLDIVVGVLTGLPIDETWGTDAIRTAQDVMREVMRLRLQVNVLQKTMRDINTLAADKLLPCWFEVNKQDALVRIERMSKAVSDVR